MITIEEFDKVEIRIGTIIESKINKGARKPAYKMKIDLGDLGLKNCSAQITELYTCEELVGKQVVVVTNFEPIRIADIKSEVRILGVDSENGVVLLNVDEKVKNGIKVF